MNISKLLNARQTLLRQANLANLAFAHETLQTFWERIVRAQLRGRVNLRTADPSVERYWATLTAREFNQSLVEEHFTEEELTDYTDAIAYATGRPQFDLSFDIENFADHFLAPLRAALEQAGVETDTDNQEVEEPKSQH